MNFYSIRSIMIAVAALLVWGPPAAEAGNAAYVSKIASGSADCSAAANACSNLVSAITFAGDGGEVFCLSAGFYTANVSLTTAITINCPQAMVQTIAINAAGKNILIRGLEFNNFSCTGGCGPLIQITAANSVTFENIVVTGGLASNTSNPTLPVILDNRAGPGKLVIRNSVITENTTPGIVIAPKSGTLTVALDNVTAWNNSYGLAVGAGGRVMINRSTFSGNTIAGIEADPGAFVGIDNSLVSSNDTGVLANPGSTIAISNTNINSNNTPISGATSSYGNNRLFANVFAGTAPTPAGAASNDTGQR